MDRATTLESALSDGIACLLCKERLSLKGVVRRRGGVQRAEIRCGSCAGTYRVFARIPVLLPPGQFADWTHPLVEMLFGNIRMGLDEAIGRYGIEKFRELYVKLASGEYRPPVLVFEQPVDRKLFASGGSRTWRSSRRLEVS